MSDFRNPQHGRDHGPRGSDPIPALNGFIAYAVENVGDWLSIEMTGTGGPLSSPFGLKFPDYFGDEVALTVGAYFGKANIGTTGADLRIDPGGDGGLVFNLDGATTDGHWTIIGDPITLWSLKNWQATTAEGLEFDVGTTFGVYADSISLNPSTLGFFGATPVTRPGTPVTLGNVISALQALGLVA